MLKAFYAALGAKNLEVLNALSCVKITDEDLEGQADDLKITVDKVEKTVINGDTASSRVTITATAGGKTQTKSGIAGFARISNRWGTGNSSQADRLHSPSRVLRRGSGPGKRADRHRR
ncbi:Uncharacterised protein [Mycobacteroides abscessus subsp. massiliense]|nr:Uncharacterised protein [Mycobacteroides abscessus subsp. massiliense]